MSDPTRLTLSAQQIELWLAFYNQITDVALLSNLRLLLNEAERQQAQRFHFPDDRQRYLVTRAMVRTVLSRYVDVAPADWVFSKNEYGRPEIVNEAAAGLNFNISHSRGLIALGISRQRIVGVDVENLTTRQVSDGIAERFFSPDEAAELASVPAAQRQDRFFEYWTFKESYIKARGMGLSIPLEQFGFHFPDERSVGLRIDPQLGDDAERWCFWQFRPTPGYLLAVCAERLTGHAPTLSARKLVVRRDAVLGDESFDLLLQKRSPLDRG